MLLLIVVVSLIDEQFDLDMHEYRDVVFLMVAFVVFVDEGEDALEDEDMPLRGKLLFLLCEQLEGIADLVFLLGDLGVEGLLPP